MTIFRTMVIVLCLAILGAGFVPSAPEAPCFIVVPVTDAKGQPQQATAPDGQTYPIFFSRG